MVQDRYSRKDVAGILNVWWDIVRKASDLEKNPEYGIDDHEIQKFLSIYHDSIKSNVDQTISVQEIYYTKLHYIWAKNSFDGAQGYEATDDIIKTMEEIGQLASALAEKTEDYEALHAVGSEILNLKKLKHHTDSQGTRHTDASTFFCSLMSRVCVDSTVLAEGLSEVRRKSKRKSGRPPVVSKNFLILSAIDMYEELLGLGPLIWTSPKNPIDADSYGGIPFWQFVLAFSDLVAPDDFPMKRANTGFASDVAKAVTAHRRDPDIAKGLNPYASPDEILLSINQLASIR